MEAQIPFEGVEKRLVVEFQADLEPNADNVSFPLSLNATDWEPVLEAAQCEIVSYRRLGNRVIYLLSESTLAVWSTGFELKTCGRTLPLAGLKKLFEIYPHTFQSVAWILFTRLDFLHPQYQPWPHQSFHQEVEFVRSLFPQVQAASVPAGSQCARIIFCGLQASRCEQTTIRVLDELLLLQIDEHCVKNLTGFDTPEEQLLDDGSAHHGILRSRCQALKGVLDEFWFEPQGYSCNALTKSSYFNCHVSPESATSYASLEQGYSFSTTRAPCKSSYHEDEEHATPWLIFELAKSFKARTMYSLRVFIGPETIVPTNEIPDVAFVEFVALNGLKCRVTHEEKSLRTVPSTMARKCDPIKVLNCFAECLV